MKREKSTSLINSAICVNECMCVCMCMYVCACACISSLYECQGNNTILLFTLYWSHSSQWNCILKLLETKLKFQIIRNVSAYAGIKGE